MHEYRQTHEFPGSLKDRAASARTRSRHLESRQAGEDTQLATVSVRCFLQRQRLTCNRNPPAIPWRLHRRRVLPPIRHIQPCNNATNSTLNTGVYNVVNKLTNICNLKQLLFTNHCHKQRLWYRSSNLIARY